MRTIHRAVIPSSGTAYMVGRRQVRCGTGVGAVLLDGGIGGQSSYSSLDDYVNTTGVNPLARQIKATSGKGLAKMNAQIENLLVKSKSGKPKKEKNINFTL